MKIMTFHLADEVYALELSAVESVMRGGSSDDVRELPLVKLTTLVGSANRLADGAPVLVLRGEDGREAELRVERLGDVVEVDDADLRAVPRYFGSSLLRGVARVGDRLVVLLDAGALIREAASLAVAGPVRAEDRP